MPAVTKRLVGLALAAMVAATAYAQTSAPAQTNAITTEPGKASMVSTTKVSARVAGIDKATRTLTLKPASGDAVKLVAGDDVRNFDQIKVGDVVVAAYVRAFTLELQKVKSTATGPVVRGEVTRAAPGQRPAGVGARQVTVMADVVALDPKKSTLTLKGPGGDVVTLDVRNPDQFKVIKVGDQIEVTYTEALAVSVEPGTGK